MHSETLNRDCSRHTQLSSFCISVHSRVASLHGEAVSVHTMLQRACHANVTDMQCRFTLCCQFAESMATCNSMPDPQKYKLQQRRSTLCCIDLLRPTVCISYSLYLSIHQASAALVDTLLFDAELALFVHSETLNRDCSRHTQCRFTPCCME